MKIALDFDNTYTADPDCFRAIIRCFQSCGHEVIVVTIRCDQKDHDPEFQILKDKYQVDTVYCDGNPKRKFCEKLGIFIDIWIDDLPEGISQGSLFTAEQLAEWREENVRKLQKISDTGLKEVNKMKDRAIDFINSYSKSA